ncbi:MAG: RNA 2',3'-cyclic phosphodiesterase [Candidatus Thorarchaeota archaeon]
MTDQIRVFLSVDINDDSLLSRIKLIQSKLDTHSAKMKMVELENIHFTWRFFGDTSTARVEKIHSELESIEISPFTIEVRGVGAFPSIHRPRVIWVGVTHNAEMMRDLKVRTDDILAGLGYQKENKFTPHATIARVRAVNDRQRISENLSALSDESVGTMTVDCIRMTKSTLTPAGPIYETLWQIS